MWTIHAEDAAVRRLPSLPKRRHLKRINLMVTRTSKTGNWGNSKPCLHCILMLTSRLPVKGWSLASIYYTDSNGDIMETSLQELSDDLSPHMSVYYRSTGFCRRCA